MHGKRENTLLVRNCLCCCARGYQRLHSKPDPRGTSKQGSFRATQHAFHHQRERNCPRFQGELEQLLKPKTQIDVATFSAAALLSDEERLSREVLLKAYFRYAINSYANNNPIALKRIKSITLTPEEESWFTHDDLWNIIGERNSIDVAKFLEIFSTKKLESLLSEPFKFSTGSLHGKIIDILQYLPVAKFPTALLEPLKKLADNKSESQDLRGKAQRVYCRFNPKNCATQ